MYRAVVLAFCLLLLIPFRAHASLTSMSDAAGLTHPHPKVVSFGVDTLGNATGFVEGGIPFRQYTVVETTGLRVQRFELEEYYHFIVNGEVVYTFNELSALLALAYTDPEHAV